MIFMLNNNKLRDFAEAIAIPLSVSDTVKWPIRAGRAIKLVKSDFANDFALQMERAIELYGEYFWKQAFSNPSQIWRVSHHLINGWKDAGNERQYIANKIEQLLNGIDVLSEGNHYEAFGSHVTASKNIANIGNGTNNRNILRLGALLWAYSETLYFVAREICCDYQGPYSYEDNTIIIIRQYANLCPDELWTQLSALKDIDKIIIKTQHADLAVSFDVYNNLYVEHGDINSSFLNGEVIIDGQTASIVEINDLINNISKEMMILHSMIEAMEEEELIWQYIRIFWYRKKGIAKLLNESWEPSIELKEKIKGYHGIKKKNSTARPTRGELIAQYDYSL